MLLEDSGCQEKVGLAFWMARVEQECERVGRDFAPEPVHDLRVALRRCRSIADGYMTYDPNRAWEEMMREGKTLFKSLGDLRDTQVMAEWVQLLAVGQDAPGNPLTDYLVIREKQTKEDGYQALQKFNLKRWALWSKQLSKRAGHIPLEGIVFQHLALVRWQQAYELHHQALRNRSQVSFHRLRIGLKRFRYTVENFLPQLHERWGKDLRELQDLLGELHDLNVLWHTAVSVGAVKEAGARAVWRSRIAEARQQRLDQYRQKMLGTASL
ncbi:MAG: CHAD domain-containing protein, partial [Acidobacteriota bacterium]